jgi:hypothetical protein
LKNTIPLNGLHYSQHLQDKIGIQPLIERELLSVIETCKEYKNILLRYHQSIIVFIYHKNNTFNGLKAPVRVLLLYWLLLLEEYGVTFEYLAGKKMLELSRMIYPVLTLIA